MVKSSDLSKALNREISCVLGVNIQPFRALREGQTENGKNIKTFFLYSLHNKVRNKQ